VARREYDPSLVEKMKYALRLARRGRGETGPNPMVGALVVRDGRIVGEGYHVYERKHHAEVEALNRAGRSARGAEMFVTLEPCCHHGRTPPCTDRIAEAGIRKVYVAVEDPNPLVRGGGIRALQQQGIEIDCGLCEREARELNEVFFQYVIHNRPFVVLKLAMSLDGRIATRSGSANWITGEKARWDVHRMRYESDAILVGINTVLADNPSLDVRWKKPSSITKIILDTTLRTPVHSRLFESRDPVILFHGRNFDRGKHAEIGARAELIEVESRDGRLPWSSILEALAEKQIQSLLVEGGGQVAGSLLQSGFLNRLVLFYAPKIIGQDGRPGFGLKGIEELSEAPGLNIRRIRRLGEDFRVEAEPAKG